MGIWTQVANVRYQLRTCSMCQQKTASSSAMAHVVMGGGGASLADYSTVRARWSHAQGPTSVREADSVQPHDTAVQAPEEPGRQRARQIHRAGSMIWRALVLI
ncbi:hypothetical protein BS78_03G227800 [Paspalum vaginatum]|nr:hypothetical protein BS78_03G227800 [Paspalum vaginatum]